MKDLQRELGLSYLFISHNLAVVDYIADRIAVMYHGEFVEVADREALFQRPTHPYTRTLLEAIPVADLDKLLDFSRIQNPADDKTETWHSGNADGELKEIAAGHWVRAKRTTLTFN